MTGRDKTHRGFGCYTNDSQMTLALATSLVKHGRVDAEQASAKCAEHYEPWTGNGGGAHVVMLALRRELGNIENGRRGRDEIIELARLDVV